jgi:hypothetical protein
MDFNFALDWWAAAFQPPFARLVSASVMWRRRRYRRDAWMAPFAAAAVGVEEVRLAKCSLPPSNVIREPHPPVWTDIGSLRETTGLDHGIKRGSPDRHDVQNLRFIEHLPRRGRARCAIYVDVVSHCLFQNSGVFVGIKRLKAAYAKRIKMRSMCARP